MKKALYSSVVMLSATPAMAQVVQTGTAENPSRMVVTVGGITQGQPIPEKFAYCAPDGKGKSKDGGNVSPAISWTGAPAGTKSFAIVMVDPDVPSKFDNANQEGKIIPTNLPRQPFYHWLAVDIPATTTSIAEGADSTAVKPAKPVGAVSYGLRGANDYGKFLGGVFGGYDGPCPPWNDAKMHRYHFNVYALDVPTLGLQGEFKGDQVMAAIKGHVLATGNIMGTYTQNAKLLAAPAAPAAAAVQGQVQKPQPAAVKKP